MQAKFGLMHGGHAMLGPAVTRVPEAARSGDRRLPGRTGCLGKGRSRSCRGVGKKALEALGKVDMGLVTGDAHMDWMKSAGELKSLLAALAAADGIEPARAQFALLSEQIAAVVDPLRCPGREALQGVVPHGLR